MAEFLVCLKQHTKDRRLMVERGFDENGKYWNPEGSYHTTADEDFNKPHPCFLGGRQPRCESLIPHP